MKPVVPKEVMKAWAEMTDNNDHRLVRWQIARWLSLHVHTSFNFYAKLFFDMELSIKEREVPYYFLDTECAVTDLMLKELYDEYKCKRLVNQINKCL